MKSVKVMIHPHHIRYSRSIVLVAVCCIASACTSVLDPLIKEGHSQTEKRTAVAQQNLRQTQNIVPLVSEDKTVRFTKNSIPFARSSMLPSSIGNITLRVPGRHNLSTVADLISNATGIPVIMTPDALQDPYAFTPGRVSTPTGNVLKDAVAEEAVFASLMAAGAGRLALNDQVALSTIELNYSGSLAGLLNQVAAKTRLRWTYEDGRVVFRRVITRSIVVKSLPGTVKSSASLSMSAGGASGGALSVASETDTDFWSALEKTLPLFVSSQGSFIVDSRVGLVIVRDAIDNVAAVERLIELQNSLFLRQIAMNVEVLQVDLSQEHQSGIDWNLLSQTLSNTNAAISMVGAPLQAGGSSTAAAFGIKAADGSNTNQAMLQLLEKFGRVSTAYSSVLTTVNRQPVPVGVLNSQAYLKSIAAAPAAATGGGTTSAPIPGGGVSLQPGEITTGFTMNLLPMVLDSNRVLLQCSISISSLRELLKFTSGTGDNAASVQQPNVDSFASLQRMTLNSGETMVIMGFERDETRSNQTDVVRNSIPGSRVLSNNKKSTVILVTPRLLGV